MIDKFLKVLLWDFEETSNLGDAIRNILSSSPHLKVEFRNERLEVESNNKDALTMSMRSFNPDLVFFVAATNSLDRIGIAMGHLRPDPFNWPIIVASEQVDAGRVSELTRLGITDFVAAPVDSENVLGKICRAIEQKHGNNGAAHSLIEDLGLGHIVGRSPAFMAEVEKLSHIAGCDVSVLITGETGTGKEVFAKAIHQLSSRADKVFVPVNCGAIPFELVENELFGHERGAYTGALGDKRGLIQEANGGTLFLDEIDGLPLMAQVKLLRFLQEKEYRPLGSLKTLDADVRIVAASSADPKDAVITGKLRRDLYYRLNVVALTLPPLRQRREDIIPLACHFLKKYAAEFRKPAERFSPNALLNLTSYDWPGNVRELEHVIEQAVVLSSHELLEDHNIARLGSQKSTVQESFHQAKTRVINEFERDYIRTLLLAHNGNITRAANSAKKDRRAFVQLIRKHKIAVQEFKSKAYEWGG